MKPVLGLFPGKRRPDRTGGGGQRHLVQIGHLLSGGVISGALMLVSTAIAARAMTTEKFGIFVLILTFVQLVERIARFESWQPLIKFASEIEARDAWEQLPRLYLYGLILDVAAACIAAGAAFAIAALFAPLFGFGDGYLGLVGICCIGTLFNITGMPTAALRLAGRFRTIAYSQLLAQPLRIVFALYCWYHHLGIQSFLIAWMAAQIAGALIFVRYGFAALRAQSIASPLTASPRHLVRDFPGFLSFAWSTNLSMTMRTMTQEADTLLVGGLAGPSAAGFYHVAKRTAKTAQQFGAQAQAVLYPDMARLWARREIRRLRALKFRVQLALGGIGFAAILTAIVFGEPIVHVALGGRYGDIAPLLVVQLVGVALIMNAAPSRSVLLSMGEPRLVLIIAGAGTAVFFASAFLLIPLEGAMGASLSQILSAGTIAAWMNIACRRGLRDQCDAKRTYPAESEPRRAAPTDATVACRPGGGVPEPR